MRNQGTAAAAVAGVSALTIGLAANGANAAFSVGDVPLPIVADSVADFSDVQGATGWWYGYYDGDAGSDSWTPGDFELATDFENGYWRVDAGEPGYWTHVTADTQHPNGAPQNGAGSKKHDVQWSVRRWVSDVEGTVIVSGLIADMRDRVAGDGVTGRVFADGVNVYERYVASSTGARTGYRFEIEVEVGSVLDFAIDPMENASFDRTLWTAQVALVPAPGAAALLGLGGIAASRRRRG